MSFRNLLFCNKPGNGQVGEILPKSLAERLAAFDFDVPKTEQLKVDLFLLQPLVPEVQRRVRQENGLEIETSTSLLGCIHIFEEDAYYGIVRSVYAPTVGSQVSSERRVKYFRTRLAPNGSDSKVEFRQLPMDIFDIQKFDPENPKLHAEKINASSCLPGSSSDVRIYAYDDETPCITLLRDYRLEEYQSTGEFLALPSSTQRMGSIEEHEWMLPEREFASLFNDGQYTAGLIGATVIAVAIMRP
ncbi:MAG TPA: hypothetical protein VFB59_02530 [Candidatus Saccharimonadales bacterium]|nr:hypothetical protein [Candidatus Saccharimonadales bacterium]